MDGYFLCVKFSIATMSIATETINETRGTIKTKNAARHKAWTALFVYIRYYFWKDSSRSPVLTRSPAAT